MSSSFDLSFCVWSATASASSRPLLSSFCISPSTPSQRLDLPAFGQSIFHTVSETGDLSLHICKTNRCHYGGPVQRLRLGLHTFQQLAKAPRLSIWINYQKFHTWRPSVRPSGWMWLQTLDSPKAAALQSLVAETRAADLAAETTPAEYVQGCCRRLSQAGMLDLS